MSSTSTNSRFQGPCCGCGVPAPLRSSNQDPNRGRRFFGCINYKQPTACGFFLWLDPERDMEKELLQVENQVLKREEEMMRGKPGYEHLNEPLHILVEAELPFEIVDGRLNLRVGIESCK
ncbi:hypothetical protein Vadar_027516 [Vaccinium darrowii]|uniref:Uncharacterized protein n=1 Tax=Vaccinium darrowii TaxID=229202 RepID=A0ACB7XKA1_9ERIC|nr:hypothetical protein Vadar_027516 [Vaccinium darrowii]